MVTSNTYQDIKSPDKLEEEKAFDGIYRELLSEFDYEEGSYSAYKDWCRKRARQILKDRKSEEEENE